MLEHYKNPNSKRFLITYLAVVILLLVLWRNGNGPAALDKREIPSDIENYLLSPPTKVTVTDPDNKLALTSDIFDNKWSFVYFSHHQCLPGCNKAFNVLGGLREHFSADNIQFVVIELDPNKRFSQSKLAKVLDEQGLSLTVMSTSIKLAEQLTAQFGELFLITNFADGGYQIDQQHQLFIVDPKARIYAKFSQPYTLETLQKAFVSMRYFYAQTE
jgi:cytochrome oxidase Cu insertion factor (SCO1/SenC/PrrC family)